MSVSSGEKTQYLALESVGTRWKWFGNYTKDL